LAKKEVKVTRKYQITIPESVRSELGIKVGDNVIVKIEEGHAVIEVPERVSDPVKVLWELFEKPMNIDAVRLVEESHAEELPADLIRPIKRRRRNPAK